MAAAWCCPGPASPCLPFPTSPPHTHTHTHSFPPFPTHSPATAGTVYGHNADDVPVQPGNSSAAVDSQTLDQKTGYRTCELRTAVRLALTCPLGSWARPGAGQPVAALSGCAGRAGRGLGPQRRPTPGAECEGTPMKTRSRPRRWLCSRVGHGLGQRGPLGHHGPGLPQGLRQHARPGAPSRCLPRRCEPPSALSCSQLPRREHAHGGPARVPCTARLLATPGQLWRAAALPGPCCCPGQSLQ